MGRQRIEPPALAAVAPSPASEPRARRFQNRVEVIGSLRVKIDASEPMDDDDVWIEKVGEVMVILTGQAAHRRRVDAANSEPLSFRRPSPRAQAPTAVSPAQRYAASGVRMTAPPPEFHMLEGAGGSKIAMPAYTEGRDLAADLLESVGIKGGIPGMYAGVQDPRILEMLREPNVQMGPEVNPWEPGGSIEIAGREGMDRNLLIGKFAGYDGLGPRPPGWQDPDFVPREAAPG